VWKLGSLLVVPLQPVESRAILEALEVTEVPEVMQVLDVFESPEMAEEWGAPPPQLSVV
jgi:hypothetical protein